MYITEVAMLAHEAKDYLFAAVVKAMYDSGVIEE